MNAALLQTTQTRINADNLKPLNKIRKYTPNSPDDEIERPSYLISPEGDKLFTPHNSARIDNLQKRNNSTTVATTQ